MKILVTGGGCEEPLDSIRSVCNFSSGRTAASLSEFFASKGNEVLLLMGFRCIKPEISENLKIKFFRTFRELEKLLKNECETGGYDAVIHAAAVSDFSPDVIELDGKKYSCGDISKIDSDCESFVVKFRKNPKLINNIKSWCGCQTRLVGFKLTSSASFEERFKAVEKVFFGSCADFVVSNDFSEITENSHPFRIYKSPEKNDFMELENSLKLSEKLLEVLK